ncbi:MAG: hypothetical protein MZV63_49020 [Marinilabiliales bacterium]|nr:hypothetical protein [Marinilabiliales bacterium]
MKYPVKKSLKTSGYYVRFSTGILVRERSKAATRAVSASIFQTATSSEMVLQLESVPGMEELGVVLVPLYADLRYTPLNSGISPYAWLKTGYGFATSDQAEPNMDYYSTVG